MAEDSSGVRLLISSASFKMLNCYALAVCYIIRECREMLKEVNIEMFYIKRSANEAAHVLARESSSFPGRVFNGRSVPVSLESILMNDLCN